jgi:DNA-binding LacI/PurR family transcriptional regulator
VLNRSAPVNEDTAARVERAVADLGYVRQRSPHLSRGHSGAVSLVMFDDMLRYQRDSFYSRLLVGAERAALRAGRELVVSTALRNAPRDTLLRYLRGGHVDGVVMVGMQADGAPALELREAGVPVMCVGRPAVTGLSYVDADNTGGARQAVSYLISSGRQAIATIAGPSNMIVADDRLTGYRSALAASGLAPAVCRGDFTVDSGEHAMLRLLDRYPTLDAVFAASDLMALGALRGLRRLGVQVPDQVAVVGFDDATLARHTMPRLTTVRQPVEELGVRAVAELLVADEPCRTTVLPTSLVRRESA